jgi:hypothetical protein
MEKVRKISRNTFVMSSLALNSKGGIIALVLILRWESTRVGYQTSGKISNNLVLECPMMEA